MNPVTSVVVTTDAEQAAEATQSGALAIWVGRGVGPQDCARIAVEVARRALAQRLVDAIACAVRASCPNTLVDIPVVRVASRDDLRRLTNALADAIAIVPVTLRNHHRLEELMDGLWAAGVAGIQLVWDGHTPSRARVEPGIFAALEKARGRRGCAPVVLSAKEDVAPALRVLIDARQRRVTP